MVDRIATVEIARANKNLIFRLRQCSVETADMFDYATLNIDAANLPALTTKQGVLDYGNQLTRALCDHQAVGRELDCFFNGLNIDLASLQFSIGTSEGERFRWETLYTEPQFLAVKGNCSVKRIIPTGLGSLPAPRFYQNPIQLLAFLCPAKVLAKSEFEAIAVALDKARNHIDIEMTVYVGERELLEDIQARSAAGQLDRITARPMPSSTQDLEEILKEKPVQLLHFFCHGYLLDGVHFLRFATISDNEAEEDDGSVDLSIERLRVILSTNKTVWVTVLNSCSGAQEASGLYSMAATLARSASPVTIGMAEQIHAEDATLFAANFYPDAFNIIAKALNSPRATIAATIDLGPAIAAARRVMFNTAQCGTSAGFRRWCLPVMYQQDAGLQVAAISLTMKERIETVAKALQGLGSDSPTKLREHIRNILAEDPAVPQDLWPDLFGKY